MIINFLGDSITEGAGASLVSKRYVELVKAKTNLTVNNYGISGTRIAKQKGHSEPASFDLDFQLRANQMEKADFVFVFGGTNDYGHGDAQIGNIDDNDPYTFCGGLNNLINILLKDYSKDKLCFMLPLHRDLEDNPRGERREFDTLPLSGYVDIMKKILEKHGVEYINLFEIGPEFSDKYFFDIVHPNDLGHEFLSNVVIDYLKKKHLI